MSEFLINIPGPTFLLLFSIFVAVVIIIAYRMMRNDPSDQLEVPEPTTLDPAELAYLNGGAFRALETVLFNLWKKELIEMDKSGPQTVVIKKNSNSQPLTQIEKYIYQALQPTNNYRQLLPLIESYRGLKEKLESMELVATPEIKQRNWLILFSSLAAILIVGVSKLYFGLSFSKPVGFLVFLLIISLIVLFVVLKPSKFSITSRGRKLLKLASIRFQDTRSNYNEETEEGSNMLNYGMAMFGIATLVGMSGFDTFATPMADESQRYDSGSSSGGCSSYNDSSSDSGSDGGSSCSGGGCGGCGGGD